MDLYINKIERRNSFRIAREVVINCNLNELLKIKQFIEEAYDELSKVNPELLPHSHFKDYLKKGSDNISDIIISIKP